MFRRNRHKAVSKAHSNQPRIINDGKNWLQTPKQSQGGQNNNRNFIRIYHANLACITLTKLSLFTSDVNYPYVCSCPPPVNNIAGKQYRDIIDRHRRYRFAFTVTHISYSSTISPSLWAKDLPTDNFNYLMWRLLGALSVELIPIVTPGRVKREKPCTNAE